MNIEQNIQYININDILPNRFQPRLTFDEEAIKELAASIKEHGIIQPIMVRRLNDNKFEIIAGERRYKASQIAGLEKVPVIITSVDDDKSAEVALVENLQRKNLSAMEEAKSYEKLLSRGNLTQEQLAKKMGISQSAVANKIRLLSLGEAAQEALINEKISERHARSLLQVKDLGQQEMLLKKTIDNRLTVRQLDDEIKKLNETTNLEKSNDTESIETFSFENSDNGETDISDEHIAELILDTKKVLEDKYEIFDIPTGEESKEEISPSDEPKFKTLDDVKEYIKEVFKEIKDAGFKIETEDYDFEDLYQIIIKLEK